MNDEIIPLEDDIYEEEIEVEEETAVMNAMWGNISGNIENQTDLQQALDAKQDNLTQAQLDAVNSGITSAKVATYDGYPAQIASAVSSEADIRRQADTTLQGNIDAEESARKAADKDIQDVLDGETLARQNADNALGGRIDTEIHDRQVADNGLQSQIDAITSKSDVVDVVASYAALQAYDTSTLGNNDVVKVLDDETHGDAMTYYRWSTTTQTWSYIGQEAPYYTKSQTDTLLLDKQDKIDATHKLSADLVDDTSTTNKFVTAQDKMNWNAKQNALTAGQNIDITNGVISTTAIAPEVVAELPATGTEGKLYLTPKNYTRSTGTGNPIEATITDEAGKMESFKLDGDTAQTTYTGKNLLSFPNGSYTSNSVTSVWENGKVVMSGKATSNQVFVTNYLTNTLTAGTYTFSMGGAEAPRRFIFRTFDADNQTIASYILEQGTTSTEVTIAGTEAKYRIFMLAVSGTTYNETDYFQLEAGSTLTSGWEPYTGGQASPNPDYPQQIQTVTGEQKVEIVGKNLLRQPYTGGTVGTGLTWTAADDGTVHVTGTIGGGNKSYFLYNRSQSQFDMPVIPAGAYKVFWSVTGSGSSPRITIQDTNGYHNSNASGIVTISTSAKPTNIYIQFTSSQSGDVDLYIKPMVIRSDEADVYKPYSYQALPLNLGKNLLNASLGFQYGYIASNGEYVSNNTIVLFNQYIEVSPATEYRFSSSHTNSNMTAVFYDASKTFISMTLVNNTSVNNFTTPTNCRYVRLQANYDATEMSQEIVDSMDLMLSTGSQDTTYAPYKTPIELCKIGTYQDYIYKDGESWKVHKAIGKYVFTGEETSTWDSTIPRIYLSVGQLSAIDIYPVYPDSQKSMPYAVVSKFTTKSFEAFYTDGESNGFAMSQTGKNFNFGDKSWTQKSDGQEDMNGAIVYYALDTDHTTDTIITDTDLIAQLEAIRTASLENGTNTITNSTPEPNLAGDMEIGYYGYNPTNRYDKFIWLDLNNNYEQIGS